MRVYFTSSQRGKKEFGEYYYKIFDYLKKQNYEILDDNIVSVPDTKFYDTLETVGREAWAELYNRNMSCLKKTDISIFECSFPSLSIGFLIQKALELNKPVIALYLKGHNPYFLSGIDNEKLVMVEYNEKSLKETLAKTMERTKAIIDTRFNFFISPRLLNYIQKASKDMGMTKSAFLRSLIIDHMRKYEKEL